MDSVLYNQEVTEEILNDIAVDLGATSFNGFGEAKFGADELNEITTSIVSKGILLSDNKCKAIISGEDINIQTGIIVFENGAKKKVTEIVNIVFEKGIYIYALNNVNAGKCEIIVSKNDPETDESVMNQDYVPIARVDEEGNLIDMRRFSVARVSLPVGNLYEEKEILLKFEGSEKGYVKLFSCELVRDYRYAICMDINIVRYRNCTFLADGEESEEIYITNDDSYKIKFIRNGMTVDIYGYSSWSNGGYTRTVKIMFV